ncbi:MAG TPA: glycoside hydrolase family 16 protein [Candidatus Sulfotelmatobacter sp.]|nr:glycoside hydrolase family 16 protein [Candidatus Sulfotelmatobacter sp.]
MKSNSQRFFLLGIILCACLPGIAQANGAKAASSEWTLVWSDEFNGPNGSAVDSSKWASETGGGGWGNDELEYYTTRPQNAYLQDGNLVIKVLQEKYTGSDGVTRNYTSARLKTQGKFTQANGRFEARIKIPRGQGIWPAFWMLGDDIDKGGWPTSGEIDIMENIGKEPALVHGTIHGPGYSGANGIGASYVLPSKQPFADDFHVYAVEWEPSAIRFYVDKDLYTTRVPSDLPQNAKWVYDHPFFLLLNVAVGGGWPGSPDATTVFPQTMLVDYVRVFRRSSAPATGK